MKTCPGGGSDQQSSRAADQDVAGRIGRDGGAAHDLDRTADVDVLELGALSAGDSGGRACPQRMIGCFKERFDSRAGQAVAHVEAEEVRTVVTIEPVLSTDPEIAGGILEHTQSREVAETL